MKRTPLRRGKPLARSTAPLRRSKLAPVGKVVKRRAKALRAAYAVVDERSGGLCEARVDGVCTGVAVEHHHVKSRGVAPSLVTEPTNVLHICRPCHDFSGANPAKARDLGIVKRSTDE